MKRDLTIVCLVAIITTGSVASEPAVVLSLSQMPRRPVTPYSRETTDTQHAQ